jgi:hypothetical protein
MCGAEHSRLHGVEIDLNAPQSTTEDTVRVLLGIILGVILTIAGTYTYDSSTGREANGLTATAADGQAPMVNWDVVGANWSLFKTNVRESADNLERSIKRHTG